MSKAIDFSAWAFVLRHRSGWIVVPPGWLSPGDEVAYMGTEEECREWDRFMAQPKAERVAPGVAKPPGDGSFPGFKFTAVPEYKVGDPVEKFGGDYGGPGRVASVMILPDGRVRYGVEHAIAGGFGTFVHIYSGKQLRPLVLAAPA